MKRELLELPPPKILPAPPLNKPPLEALLKRLAPVLPKRDGVDPVLPKRLLVFPKEDPVPPNKPPPDWNDAELCTWGKGFCSVETTSVKSDKSMITEPFQTNASISAVSCSKMGFHHE